MELKVKVAMVILALATLIAVGLFVVTAVQDPEFLILPVVFGVGAILFWAVFTIVDWRDGHYG